MLRHIVMCGVRNEHAPSFNLGDHLALALDWYCHQQLMQLTCKAACQYNIDELIG